MASSSIIMKKNGDIRRTFIFLHGWRSESAAWFPLINELKADDAAYCIDLPGFGKSESPKNDYTVSDYATIVSVFIRKLQLRNIILIGHSFGGRVSIKFGADNPDFLNGMVLCDSSGFTNKTTVKNVTNIIAKILKPIFVFQPLTGFKKTLYRMIGAEDYVATPHLKGTFLNVVNENLSEDMRRLKMPVLLLWGDQDKETPLSAAYRMHNLIPKNMLMVIKNAGHFPFLDKTKECAKAIDHYATDVSRS
jgi:pimeloyl-ACP methyl ester carboxylesterase